MPEEKIMEQISNIPKNVEVEVEKDEKLKEKVIEKPLTDVEKTQEILIKNKVEQVRPVAEKAAEGGLAAQSSISSIQKRREEAIDKILSEGLNDIFLSLTPIKQKEFQAKGEETVKKINILLSEAKVKVNKIIDLIKKWLKIIPGVNKFFLEQETKLKVDKIMKIKDNV
jgi:hypothetical protein